MQYLRQGATHKVLIGPVVAVGDGFTPVTTLALTTADEAEALVHDSATVVDISGYTWAAVATADGYYVLTLQSGISGTVGHMTVLVNDDSLCLPVRADFTVVEEAVYDAFYAASATGVPAAGALEATAQSILTDTGTTLQAELDAIQAAVITNAAGVDIAADIIALKAETAAILVDTGTTLQAEVDAIQAAVITNAAGVDIAADIIALKAETAAILTDTGTTLQAELDGIQTDTEDIQARLPAALTIDGNIKADTLRIGGTLQTANDVGADVDAILVDTAEIGAAGAGLTAVPWNANWDAEVESEVNDAIDTAIAELGVAAPTATPTLRTGMMLMYMALRNKLVVQTSGTDAIEIHNDAGTKIASKAITDDGSDYTEAEMA